MVRGRGRAEVVRVDNLALARDNLPLRFDLLILVFDPLRLRGDSLPIIFDKQISADPKKGGSNYLGIASHYLFDNSKHLYRCFEL
ncbi:hypothetical protein U6A24_17555 [Aquimarina gracilis]|uniref:Uncharacterized protein n=1 Tax=Aquimarina gracilis TaxID=874422 RepID=A0ABU5ZZJ4_9FLAO|nr:hypothetical protein [Aquimarina gracilis]MEB3347286.1 hypothetical protein [Aquimarina gracilis]